MKINKIFAKSKKNELLSEPEALFLIKTPEPELPKLFQYARELREQFQGKNILLCGIINAKSGKCSEDCNFCAQSAHHKTKIKTYPLLAKDKIVEATNKARDNGINCFSIVTSGKGIVNAKNFQEILATIQKIKGINRCTSLGILSKDQFKQLKEAGLDKYHHNLETAESFFPKMCTTHSYKDRLETIKKAKKAGLKVCVGGIFGIGESPEQRVELGLAIKKLDPESVPINIVHPIEGTKIYNKTEKISVNDILRLIATYRFLMPDKIIGVFGGREQNLGKDQHRIFEAGANSILVGNYLTTKGNPIEKDLDMIKSAGMQTSSLISVKPEKWV